MTCVNWFSALVTEHSRNKEQQQEYWHCLLFQTISMGNKRFISYSFQRGRRRSRSRQVPPNIQQLIRFYLRMEALRYILLVSIFLLASAQESLSPTNAAPSSQQNQLQEGKGIVRRLNGNQFLTLVYFEKEGSANFDSIYLRINLIGHGDLSSSCSVRASIKNGLGETVGLSIISQKSTTESLTVEFPLRKGTYSIVISANQNVKISIILTKQYLNHLKFYSNEVMTKAGVSEFYSQRAEIIEVYQCSGDIRVTASSNYDDLSSGEESRSVIALEEANYGGHFLIDTKKGSGEYFIKVEGKNGQANIDYFINHYYYNSGIALPHLITSLPSREVAYTVDKDNGNLIFTISTISVDSSPSIAYDSTMIEYFVFFGDNREKVQRLMNCRTGYLNHRKTETFVDYNAILIVNLDVIRGFVGDSELFYVGAMTRVFFDPIDKLDYKDYPHQFRFIYDTIELNQTSIREIAKMGRIQPNISTYLTQKHENEVNSTQSIVVMFLAVILLLFVLRWFQQKKQQCNVRGRTQFKEIQDQAHLQHNIS